MGNKTFWQLSYLSDRRDFNCMRTKKSGVYRFSLIQSRLGCTCDAVSRWKLGTPCMSFHRFHTESGDYERLTYSAIILIQKRKTALGLRASKLEYIYVIKYKLQNNCTNSPTHPSVSKTKYKQIKLTVTKKKKSVSCHFKKWKWTVDNVFEKYVIKSLIFYALTQPNLT